MQEREGTGKEKMDGSIDGKKCKGEKTETLVGGRGEERRNECEGVPEKNTEWGDGFFFIFCFFFSYLNLMDTA